VEARPSGGEEREALKFMRRREEKRLKLSGCVLWYVVMVLYTKSAALSYIDTLVG